MSIKLVFLLKNASTGDPTAKKVMTGINHNKIPYIFVSILNMGLLVTCYIVAEIMSDFDIKVRIFS